MHVRKIKDKINREENVHMKADNGVGRIVLDCKVL